jgi:hypothetical protein
MDSVAWTVAGSEERLVSHARKHYSPEFRMVCLNIQTMNGKMFPTMLRISFRNY